MPFGIPYSEEELSSINLLCNDDYINAFSLKYRFPLWSSFTLPEQKKYNNYTTICLFRGDVRVPSNSSPKCNDLTKTTSKHPDLSLVLQPLYPPGFSDFSKMGEATYITNAVVKSSLHGNVIQKNFDEMLSRWVSQTGELNVVTGPAFDINASGVKPNLKEFTKMAEKNGPMLIPTHIFVIATWCTIKTDSLKNCHPSKLQSQGYLLPNEPYPNTNNDKPIPSTCEAAADVINKNVARVADIEKLTGLSFYMGLPIYEAIRLRTMMPERLF